MGWLENNMYFSKRKLEKDHLLAKFGWNFKFYTSGHPELLQPSDDKGMRRTFLVRSF